MALNYKLLLVDKNNAPKTSARVYFYRENNSGERGKYLGRDITDQSGISIKNDSTAPQSDELPSIFIRFYISKVGNIYTKLSPRSSEGDTIDYGTVMVGDNTVEQQAVVAKKFIKKVAVELDVDALQAKLATLETDKSNLSKKATEEESKRKVLEKEVAELTPFKKRATDAEAKNESLEAEVAQLKPFRQKATAAESKNKLLEKEIADLKPFKQKVTEAESKNALLAKEIAELKPFKQRVNDAEEKRKKAEAQVTELQEQLEQAKKQKWTAGGDTSLTDLFDVTQEQIQSASRKILARKGGHRLGKIRMKLKGLPAAGGAGLKFVSKDEMGTVGADSLSEIEMEFSPGTESKSRSLPKIPNVVGYTETMATRKLTASGFEIEIVKETVVEKQGKPAQVGRVVRQIPAAKTNADFNTIVTVAIGVAAETSTSVR